MSSQVLSSELNTLSIDAVSQNPTTYSSPALQDSHSELSTLLFVIPLSIFLSFLKMTTSLKRCKLLFTDKILLRFFS